MSKENKEALISFSPLNKLKRMNKELFSLWLYETFWDNDTLGACPKLNNLHKMIEKSRIIPFIADCFRLHFPLASCSLPQMKARAHVRK